MKKVYLGTHNVISPLGFDTYSTYQQIQAGTSALQPYAFPDDDSTYWAAALDTDRLDEMFRKHSKQAYFRLEKMMILALAPVLESVDCRSRQTALLVCTTKGNIDQLASPFGRLDMLASRVAAHFGFINSPLVVSNACISSLEGIIVAQRLIRAGQYRQVAVVGGDILSPFTLRGFSSFNALSDEPCRPFDAQRKGINLGEAAAAVIVTDTPDSGIELVAGSVTNDAHHLSAPSREATGLIQAIRQVQQDTPDFICAHGTATVYNDEMEALAFHQTGLSQVPAFSLKGYLGHTLGAAGLLETLLSLEALKDEQLVVSKGFSESGTTHALAVTQLAVRQQKITKPMRGFLKTSSGFGGCNAAVSIQRHYV